jgi:hypothetical protein
VKRKHVPRGFAAAGTLVLALFGCLLMVTGKIAGQVITPPGAVSGAVGTQPAPVLPPGLTARTTVIPLHGATQEDIKADTSAGSTIPMWSYTTTSTRDGFAYSGTMVGASPFTNPGTSTSVPTQIVPLIIHMMSGGRTFDPTAGDPCAAAPLTNTSDLVLFQNSPIILNHAYTMNGVSIGATQYVDAFQQASFWSLVGGQNYHVLLSPPTTLPAITVNIPAGSGAAFSFSSNPCQTLGIVDYAYMQNYLEGTLIPSLAGEGVNPATFPIFLLGNVVMADPYVGTTSNCCILGYHSAFGFPVQTYGISDFDTSGLFFGVADASVMAHEVGEWMNDPLGSNPVPFWGGSGQQSNCQSNLEVGDPLSGTLFPNVTMPNGYTYHLQELAFFSWFLGSPSLAAGGKFSNNGTFAGQAHSCPPGGTNNAPPTITSQPASQVIAGGATAMMSVAASGSGMGGAFAYQWYAGASGVTTNPISGAISSTYTTPALSSTTSYWVKVSDANGTAYSNTATISVVAATVTADSVTPASGSGASQVFALQYSDSAGASNLSSTWVWFNASFAMTAANSCLAYYSPPTNTLNLLNDAGSAYTSATIGTSGTLQNSQCTIAMGSTTVMKSGSALTLNLSLTFAPVFNGMKNVYMFANAGGSSSGWQTRGTWTVPGVMATVTADSVTPNAGMGASQSFALQYSDTAGAMDLATTWAWFNATFAPTAASSCLVYYSHGTNTVSLLNDAGSAWIVGTVGAAGTLQNSQCAVALGTSTTVAFNANALTLTLAMTFAPGYNGAKNVYMYAANGSGSASGWQTRGTWTVPGVVATVTADLVTPASGSGASQSFALQYSDTAGAMDLATTWVWFTATFGSSAANSCLVYYSRGTNTVSLLNDAGTAWIAGTVGAAGTLQNSQCTVALGTSTTVALNGNALTLTLAMTFAPGYSGAKSVFMYAANGSGSASGWQPRGTWTVAIVTADSVTPASGSGASQSFALQYSDTAGAMDLATTWVWFTATFGSSAANSCLVYYSRGTNTVSLLNDAGNAWMPGSVGAAGTLQNNQCTVALGTSTTVALNGNALTPTLAMTFAPGYSGAKSVFMYAANGSGSASGWQTKGSWTVP